MKRIAAFCVGLIWAGLATGGYAAPALDDRLKSDLLGLETLAGPELERAALDGRVVVVTFFASWCPPCHVEFKHLNTLHERYREDGVSIVAINLFEYHGRFEDDGARLNRFLAKFDPSFSVVTGTDDIANAFAGVQRIPTMFVFDRAGVPTLHFIHERGAEQTNPELADVIAAIESAL